MLIAKFAVAWTLTVSVFCSGPAAADDCRRVNLDDQHPTAVIGTQPKLNNFGPGQVYISLAAVPVKDLSSKKS